MDLSRFFASTEFNCEGNGGKGDYFELLALPDEMVDLAFSFLDVGDRMRMRLNKRLNKIVEESKYYLEKMVLKCREEDNKCVKSENRWYPIDFVERIARNIFIGNVATIFPDSVEFAHKFCKIIKEFRKIREISISVRSEERAREILTDSFVLDLSRRCEFLELDGPNIDTLSAGGLHNVYKTMRDTERLRYLNLSFIKLETLHGFFNFLGVTFRNGQVFSNRNIEAYKDVERDSQIYFVNIFDGLSQIEFIGSDGDGNDECWYFMIDLHKNLELLNKAKANKIDVMQNRVRMNVYPE